MPIASLVLTLDAESELRSAAIARLVADTRIDVGRGHGPYLPIVVDTETIDQGVDVAQSLLATPGVLGLDVVRIDFDSDTPEVNEHGP